MITYTMISPNSTNSGLRVENARYQKVFQNDLNNPVRTPMIWNLGADWNKVKNLSQISNTQFALPRGYFVVIIRLRVYSPTSAKLQYGITYDFGGVTQPDIAYSAILIATDYAHTDFLIHLANPSDGTILEFFGQQSGSGGTIDTLDGMLSFLRLSNLIDYPI